MFLPKVFQLLLSMREWNKDGTLVIKVVPEGEKEKIFVTHNESVFNTND